MTSLPTEAVEAGAHAICDDADFPPEDWNLFIPRSKACLKAAVPHLLRSMMEPTDAMVVFGHKPLREDAYEGAWITDDELTGAWQAMLKAYAAEHNIPMDQEKGHD